MDATPRRLVLRAGRIEGAAGRHRRVGAGSAEIGRSGRGAGFAKKMGVKPEELGTETTAKGEYLSFAS